MRGEVKLGSADDVSPCWSSSPDSLPQTSQSGFSLSLPGRVRMRGDISGPCNHLFLFLLSKPSWGLFACLISIFPISLGSLKFKAKVLQIRGKAGESKE